MLVCRAFQGRDLLAGCDVVGSNEGVVEHSNSRQNAVVLLHGMFLAFADEAMGAERDVDEGCR